jgi:transcriptional regulator with XRE-family HTH domain
MVTVSPIDEFVIDQIKRRRVARQLSKAGLAKLVGISASYIGRVENPATPDRYSLQRINDLARALDCSVHDLLPETTI